MRLLVTLLWLSIPVAAAAEDGEKLFTPCRACHSLDPAVHNMPGPNLSGVIGRRIGGDEAFDYSPVLRKAREDGLRWDTQRLEKFLTDPAEMFPGLWMSMRGIEDAGERQALIRFLTAPASR